MKRCLILLPLMLGACAQTTRWSDLAPIGPCAVDPIRMRYAGIKYDQDMRYSLQRAANARVLRVTHPGDMVTMDFRPNRLTVTINDEKQIVGLRCG